MIRRGFGQHRRAFAGLLVIALVALAVGVAQALAGTGKATAPIEKNKEECGADAGTSTIGSVTFTRIDKTTLRTVVRLQNFSPSTKYDVWVVGGGPGVCGLFTHVGTVKTDSDGQAKATFTSSTNGYKSFWVWIPPHVCCGLVEGESVSVKVGG